MRRSLTSDSLMIEEDILYGADSETLNHYIPSICTTNDGKLPVKVNPKGHLLVGPTQPYRNPADASFITVSSFTKQTRHPAPQQLQAKKEEEFYPSFHRSC